jgi:hypothetical protein
MDDVQDKKDEIECETEPYKSISYNEICELMDFMTDNDIISVESVSEDRQIAIGIRHIADRLDKIGVGIFVLNKTLMKLSEKLEGKLGK